MLKAWLRGVAAKLRGRPRAPPAPAPTFVYFRAFVALLLAQHLFEQYVRVRRRRRLSRRQVPEAVRAAMPGVDEDAYSRAQQYATAKNSFGFLADTFLLVGELALLVAAPALWNGPACRLVVHWLGLTPAHELARMWCSLLLMGPLELLLKVMACLSSPTGRQPANHSLMFDGMFPPTTTAS
jgi:hypothetical protein